MEKVDKQPSVDSVIGFFDYWQAPAKTELAAYEAVANSSCLKGDFIYLAFPWATLIDSLKSETFALSAKVLQELAIIQHRLQSISDKKVVTVCQHVSCLDFLYLFEACKVTHIFWSHKSKTLVTKNGIIFHAFPLYPAQTYGKNDYRRFISPDVTRRWLANFVGAFNPEIYISDTRAHILEDADKCSDCFILRREGWHFEQAVYDRQIKGLRGNQSQLSHEEKHRLEYLSVIGNSTFTLCPTGSGINSIRLWESVQLGSIPVILTLALDLPGEPSLWKNACIFFEDSKAGYTNAMRRIRDMSCAEIRFRQGMLAKLANVILPASYDLIIKNAIAQLEEEPS